MNHLPLLLKEDLKWRMTALTGESVLMVLKNTGIFKQPARACPTRLRMRVHYLPTILFLAIFALTVSAAAPGTHVATIEMDAPPATVSDPFTIHATIPIPDGEYTMAMRGDGYSPFGIVDSTGATVPAQAIPVSRLPNGKADVVELIVRVNRGAAAPGTRIQYKVVASPNNHADWPAAAITVQGTIANGPASTHQDVKDLVNQPLKVRAHDVYGNTYEADLIQQYTGQPRLFKYGNESVEIRTHNPLLPVVGSTNPLPHLMGVHAYFTAKKNEPVLEIDLRIHNAFSGISVGGTNIIALQKLYFKDFEILVPNGYELNYLFTHPSNGTPYTEGTYTVYPIIQTLSGGKMNLMAERAHKDVRFVLNKPSNRSRAQALAEYIGLAFSVNGTSTTTGFGELWSWANPATAAYFPQKIFLPTLDYLTSGKAGLRNWLKNNYTARKNTYQTGAIDAWFLFGALGPYTPSNIQYGGGTSGTDIDLTSGHTALMAGSREGVLEQMILQFTSNDRETNFLYRPDGDALRYEDAITTATNGQPIVAARKFGDFDYTYNCPGSGMPSGKCDVFGYNAAPLFQTQYVIAQGLQPSWEADYLAFDDHDAQHLIRGTKDEMALSWILNRGAAKDDVAVQGELAHFERATLPMGYNGSNPVYNPSGTLTGTGSNGIGTGGEEDLITYHTS